MFQCSKDPNLSIVDLKQIATKIRILDFSKYDTVFPGVASPKDRLIVLEGKVGVVKDPSLVTSLGE